MPPVWPSSIPAPSWPVVKIPEFSTQVVSYGSAVEQRLAMWAAPRHRFQLQWHLLSTAEIDEIMKFYLARKGAYEAFWWPNPEEASNAARKWQASTAYAVNDIVVPTTLNGRSYICTAAGTSGASEPAWPTTEAATVADNTVTWKENSYLVRFEVDMLNVEYFTYLLYGLRQITFVEVAA